MHIDDLLGKINRIHFIGIGGSGMCPLAEILIAKGYTLTGSDNNPGDNINKLRTLGATINMEQVPENLEQFKPELIVYTNAILPGNPELEAAKASGVPCVERAILFGAVSRMYDNCIGVCGTHGKTTTTSLLSQLLLENGADPTLVIGGRLPLIDSHGRFGSSQTMVCEACEFKDTFLELSPDTAIILNIDNDHMEYFGTIENSIRSFTKFADMTTNLIVYNGDDANTVRAIENMTSKEGKKFITFGFDPSNDYTAENITYNRGAFPEFDIIAYGKCIGHVALNIPGKHNVLNALSAVAVAIENGIGMDAITKTIGNFRGAGRRFEVLGEFGGITIADDYAHHPTELKATLEAVMTMGYKHVWAVFQPFTYSRTKTHMKAFAEALSIPDYAVMTEIMGSREVNTDGVYTSQLAELIPGSVWYETQKEVADYVMSKAEPGDLIITLGCGDIYKAAQYMAKTYEEKTNG
ncbi:MAG: UDP-N-acetylmuramate--L-alanine ligase [Clostridia bacterium]|nr:UDP-N-acetylmuramate--L-alanine ligase [Clostridia bacterium]